MPFNYSRNKQKKKNFNGGNLNLYKSKNLKRRAFFKIHFKRHFKLKPILKIYDFDFFFRLKTDKKHFNINLIKKFIKKSDVEVEFLSMDYDAISISKKEVFDCENFNITNRKIHKISHRNIIDTIRYFFQIYKSNHMF